MARVEIYYIYLHLELIKIPSKDMWGPCSLTPLETLLIRRSATHTRQEEHDCMIERERETVRCWRVSGEVE